jgi:hypothetical protein
MAQEMHAKGVMRYGGRVTLFFDDNGASALVAVTQAETDASRRGIVR